MKFLLLLLCCACHSTLITDDNEPWYRFMGGLVAPYCVEEVNVRCFPASLAATSCLGGILHYVIYWRLLDGLIGYTCDHFIFQRKLAANSPKYQKCSSSSKNSVPPQLGQIIDLNQAVKTSTKRVAPTIQCAVLPLVCKLQPGGFTNRKYVSDPSPKVYN